jgi:hypothetical protein
MVSSIKKIVTVVVFETFIGSCMFQLLFFAGKRDFFSCSSYLSAKTDIFSFRIMVEIVSGRMQEH